MKTADAEASSLLEMMERLERVTAADLSQQFQKVRRELPDLHAALTLLGMSLASRAVLAVDPKLPSGSTKDDPIPLDTTGALGRILLPVSGTSNGPLRLAESPVGDPLWWIRQEWAKKVVQALVQDALRKQRACELCARLQRLLEEQALIEFVFRGRVVEPPDLHCCAD